MKKIADRQLPIGSLMAVGERLLLIGNWQLPIGNELWLRK